MRDNVEDPVVDISISKPCYPRRRSPVGTHTLPAYLESYCILSDSCKLFSQSHLRRVLILVPIRDMEDGNGESATRIVDMEMVSQETND
jgi:hypothetical protein